MPQDDNTAMWSPENKMGTVPELGLVWAEEALVLRDHL